MKNKLSRRDLLRLIGATGTGTMLGSQLFPEHAQADTMGNGAPAHIQNGKIVQPQRELSVLKQTDVLIVGGGPAGVCAAIAAARAGAKTTLVERYGHLGGLWTGGLVVLVIGHFVVGNKQVCMGIGEEMMQRLERLDRGICNRRKGVDPTVDAEALKYVMVEMVVEAGVDVVLHCWGVDAIMDGNTVKGAVFESKSGRQAIVAKTVVDATGDGDIYGAAGAEHEHRRYHIGLPCRIGNLDRAEPKGERPPNVGSRTPVKGVNWINMHGPGGKDGLDVQELSRLEVAHRKYIWKHIEKIRSTPGYEKVYLMETAPQLGVRITRVLKGENAIRKADHDAGKRFKDVIAVGGVTGHNRKNCPNPNPWFVPYGALVPQKVDNILASGRCISFDHKMTEWVRLIPNCFTTGHAAGVAAAVAVKSGRRPRDVDVAEVQKILQKQNAYLG